MDVVAAIKGRVEIEVNDEEIFWCSAWLGLADLADLISVTFDWSRVPWHSSRNFAALLQICMTRNPPYTAQQFLFNIALSFCLIIHKSIQYVYEYFCECTATCVEYQWLLTDIWASSIPKTRIWGTKTALKTGEVRVLGFLTKRAKLIGHSKRGQPSDTT